MQHRPLRGIDAASGYEGPRWRLVLADGRARTPIDVLFAGDADSELTPLLFAGEALVAGGLPLTVWEDRRQVAALDRHTTTVRALAASSEGGRVAERGLGRRRRRLGPQLLDAVASGARTAANRSTPLRSGPTGPRS